MKQDLDLIVIGGHIVDPWSGLDGPSSVAVADGSIVEVGPDIDPARAKRVVDARGHKVLPGIVDSHVHLPGKLSPGTPGASHRHLAVAGVTTAVEFASFGKVLDEWHVSAAGLTLLGLEGTPAYSSTVSSSQVRDQVSQALQLGAVGVKILGGHFPSTPEASYDIITEATDLGAYVGFHAGTTRHGSDLNGMIEALELADGRPLHLAHTNAYLRGAVHDLIEENNTALTLLRKNPRVVSESHLAPLNLAFGEFENEVPVDHIARNCLALQGFPVNRAGLEAAIAGSRAYVHSATSPVPSTGPDGMHNLASQDAPMLSFPVNRRLTAYLQATARIPDTGEVQYEGDGEFVVDAISSDGGGWRNLILDQGVLLVAFGALSWSQLVDKICLSPANLFGLSKKGRLSVGADADLIVVDEQTRSAVTTVARGEIIAAGGVSVGTGGMVLTTEEGVRSLTADGIPHQVLDLSTSKFMNKGVAEDVGQ